MFTNTVIIVKSTQGHEQQADSTRKESVMTLLPAKGLSSARKPGAQWQSSRNDVAS